MNIRANPVEKTQEGFTLVELLIVIAILGVLATVVLVALNPLEQLARGRDAGRIAATAQLGKSEQNYFTAQGGASYPVAAAGWQANVLVPAKELSTILVAPNPQVACGAAANQDSGFCYADLNTQSDFAVWVILESTNEKTKASCTASGKQVAAVYFGSKGKVQLDCLNTSATIPSATDTLYNP